MGKYVYRNTNEAVWAAKPTEPSLQFLQEAEKRGITLYAIEPYLTSKFQFGPKEYAYFGTGPFSIVAKAEQWLILFNDGDYFAVSEDVFQYLFKPADGAEDTGTVSPPASDTPFPDEPGETEKPLQGKSFYVDSGHGGNDPGAVNSQLNLQEKIAALDIALYLGEILQSKGAQVYYSRTDNDTRPGLSARANEANQLGVTAFISIHLNAAENTAASGIETLVYSKGIAAYTLAEKVQTQMVAATGWKNRGVKERPDLTVLSKTKMSAILCEVGFISNDAEATELFKQPVQLRIADAIAKGIQEFYA